MNETNPFELLANKETTTGEPVTEQAQHSAHHRPRRISSQGVPC